MFKGPSRHRTRLRRNVTGNVNRWAAALFTLFCSIAPLARAGAPPEVVVSVKPVHSLVAGLMDGIAWPELLVQDGSPFEFEPSAENLAALRQADLVVWVGPELEPGLAEALRDPALSDRTLELLGMEALKVLPARHDEGHRDPFFWLDTRNMLILVDELAARLAARDPVRAHRYRDNRRRVRERLAQIDRQLEYGYKDVSALPVFAYHDTHQYFEQAYAMKVAGIAAAPNRPPATADLLQIRQLLAGPGRSCLLVEVDLPAPHIDLLLDGTAARPVELDTLGSRRAPGPDLYVGLMRDRYRAIRDCIAATGTTVEATAPARADDGTAPDLYSHRIQGRYLLMNHFGEPVSNLDYAGSFQLIYFGYTFCPDVCPTSLAAMTQALKLLGPKAERIQPIFITVDPERDTLEALRKYTAYFHPRLIGLTGPPEMIARTADGFRVRYEKVELEDRPADRYAVDHTSALFLLGPGTEFVAKFAHGLPASQLAARLDELVAD